LFYACNKPGTVVHCFTYETERIPTGRFEQCRRGEKTLSTEYIWETFDSLFKTVHRQGRRVEELETRLADLERRLQERSLVQQPKSVEQVRSEMPAERAA
jgi:hypothetical protein